MSAGRRARSRPDDLRFMRRCLELAIKARGRTYPNPLVGAVLVKAGRVVAEAWHRRAGGSHAERAALRRAGAASRGATLYVNLEPCNHHGRTPPCAEAIVAAGIRRVVASHGDPFHLVRGKGFEALRGAGVEVEVGALAREARAINARYLGYAGEGRPSVLVKAAMTLDGRIAAPDGRSRWISSPESRALAHALRGVHDGIMVGANTIARDDPLLTARGRIAGIRLRQPMRIVIDGRLRTRPDARILRDRTGGRVLIYTLRGAPRSRSLRLEASGATVVALGRRGDRRIGLRAVMKDLARRGVGSVMIEGGGELIGGAFEAGLVDKVSLFVAPLILGGRSAVPVVGGLGAPSLKLATGLDEVTVRRLGPDLLVEAYVTRRRR